MSQMTLPPEGECPDPLDTQLNALYSISSNIELAIIKGQKEQAKALLADGLAQSCQLLHQLQGIDLLKPVIPSETIRRMASKGEQVLKFLRLERELLKQTKLDPQVTDYLLGKLRELINSGTELPQNWRQDLDLLAKLVCEEANKDSGAREPTVTYTRHYGGRWRAYSHTELTAAGTRCIVTASHHPLDLWRCLADFGSVPRSIEILFSQKRTLGRALKVGLRVSRKRPAALRTSGVNNREPGTARGRP
jgi:hypothetical protein